MDEYNNNEYSSQDNSQHVIYPTPQLTPEEKKPKKKGRFLRFIRFTAAALAFGILAGAATSGYDYFTRPKNEASVEETSETSKNDTLTATPVGNEKTEVNVLPAITEGDGVVSDVSDVVSKVMPSIVAINSSSTQTRYDFFGRQFNEPVKGSGSGIIIAQNSNSILILTNNHVIEGAETVEIVFSDETTANARIKGAEASADLAVLEVNMKDLSQETLKAIKVANLGDSNQLKAGQMAIAIGNALGYGQSVTVGYISALNREVTIDDKKMTLLQTDAAINPGNSGGALINTSGEVIGINSVKFASQQVEGMGYAIPISDAIPMINQLMNREIIDKTEVGFLGINLQTAQEVTDSFAKQFNMPVGIYINDVIEGSPADKAGLKSGYIIVAIDGIKIKNINDLANTISFYRAGETVTLTVSSLNDGIYENKDISVTLSERP